MTFFLKEKNYEKKFSKTTSKHKCIEIEDNRIGNLIKKKKLYLNSKLSLQDVAKTLNLNTSYASHIFNKNSVVNFSQYVNSLRINHAKKILIDSNFEHYTLVSIALESGFNSKSAFYNAFKKETGLTPTEFRKQNLS